MMKAKSFNKIAGSANIVVDREHEAIVNFSTKGLLLKNVEKKTSDFVVHAVPERLEVYENEVEEYPRWFKIWWTSDLTNDVFLTSGTISEIAETLIDSGFSTIPDMVKPVLVAAINMLNSNNLVGHHPTLVFVGDD